MWILVLEGRMHDAPARRDVTTEGKGGAAARHQVMSTEVERLMEVMCQAETATIRAPRNATTTVAAAATARGDRRLARSRLDRLRRICLALPGAWEKVSRGEATHVTQSLLLARSPERYFAPPTSARVDGSASISTTHPSGLRFRSDCSMHTNWPRPVVDAPPRGVYEVWTFLKSARKNQA